MGRRGPAPKLAELRALEGGTGRKGAVSHRPKTRVTVLAPRVTADTRPPRPKDLPAEAVALWDEAIEFLIDLGAAQMIDVPALRRMCFAYAMAEQATKQIGSELVVEGSKGQPVENPLLKVAARASAEFLRYAGEFGLTTLARTRLGLMDTQRRTLEAELNDVLGKNPRHARR